jgi:glycolate oxidase
LERTVAAGAEIIQHCVSVGGTITGEHGVGMEKDKLMPLLFSESDLEVMKLLREAFNRNSILNPQKIFPTTRSCRETGAAAISPELRKA